MKILILLAIFSLIFLTLLVETVDAEVFYFNMTDNSTNKAYEACAAGSKPPGWTDNWGGAEVNGSDYNNMRTNDGNYAQTITCGTGNPETFMRFNFTINHTIGSISEINVTLDGYENAAEASACYIANFTNNQWTDWGTPPSSDGTISINFTLQEDIIKLKSSSDNQTVVMCQGNDYDAPDYLFVDYVRVIVTAQKPWFSNLQTNDTTYSEGEWINHSANINGSAGYIFSWNGTEGCSGGWSNSSYVTINDAWTTNVSFTAQNQTLIQTGCSGNTISFKYFAENTIGWNVSTIFNYTVEAGADNTLPTCYNFIDNSTSGTSNKAYRGQTVNISSICEDNSALSTAWLSTNETGSWRNYTAGYSGSYGSPRVLSTSPILVNFSWLNLTGRPRTIGWVIFANDTTNNTNGTNQPATITYQGNFTMWGWSNISRMTPVPGTTYDTMSRQNITLIAFVNDSNSSGSGPIENYMVNFSWRNLTHEIFLGTNFTNASGYAVWEWNISGLLSGTYFPQVNISINSTLYYNVSGYNNTNTTINLIAIYTPNISQTFSTNSQYDKPASFSRIPEQLFRFDTNSPKLLSAFREPAQFLTSSQSFIRALGNIRDVIGSFSLSNIIEKVPNFMRELTGSFSTQALTSRLTILYRNFSNTFPLTGNVIKIASFPRNFVQSFNTSDAVSRLLAFSRNIANSFSTSAITTRLTVLFKNIAGSFTLTGNAIETSLFSRFTTGYFSVNTAFDLTFGFLKNFGQSLGITDMTSRLFLFSKNIGQTFNLNSTVTRIASFSRYVTQSFTVDVISSRLLTLTKSMINSFNLQTITSRVFAAQRALSQSTVFNAVTTRLIVLSKSLSQTFNLNQIVGRVVSLQKLMANSFILNAISQKVSSFVINIPNSFTVSAFTTRLAAFSRAITGRFTLTSVGLVPSGPTEILVNIFFSVTDTIQRNILATRTVAQTFSLNAITSRVSLIYKTLSQNFSTSAITLPLGLFSRTIGQAVDLTEITTRLIVLSRNISQLFNLNSVADSISSFSRISGQAFTFSSSTIIGRLYPRFASITMNLIENVQRTIYLNRITTSILTVNSYVERVFQPLRSITQSFSITSSMSRAIVLTRSAIQSFTANIISSKFTTLTKSVINSFNLQTITSRIFAAQRALSQSTVFNAVTTRLIVLSRSITNSIILSNISAKSVNFMKVVTQLFTINSITEKVSAFSRATTNIFSISSITERLLSLNRNFVGQFILTSIGKSRTGDIFPIVVGAFFTVSDNIQRGFIFNRGLIQSISLTEIASRLTILFRNISQSFVISDAFMRFRGFPTIVSQSFNLSTVTSSLNSFSRTLTQSLDASAISSRTSLLLRAASQTVGINQITSRASLLSKNITQFFNLDSSIARIFTVSRIVTQALPLNQAVSRSFSFSREIAGTFSLNEITTRIASLSKIVTVSFSTNTATIRFLSFPKTVSQAFSITDVASRLTIISRSITEGISTTVITSRFFVLTRSFTQIFSIREYVSSVSSQAFERITTLAIRINDSVIRTYQAIRSVREVFNINAITSRATNLFRTFVSYFTFTFGVNISCPPLCLPVPPSAPPPSGPSGGGGITGVSAVEIKKEISVEFIKWSILEEVIPGQATVQDILVKNKGNENIKGLKIEVEGVSKEWVFVTPETIDLVPSEMKSFTISIAVPKDAEPGDYRVIVTLKNSGVDDRTFFILRIRDYIRADTPIVTRVINLDYSKNRTEVDLTVSNTYRNISLVQVLEDVPKDLAKTSDEIEFITSPTEILRKDPLIQWDLLNMLAGESRTVSYAVKNILKEYSAYIYFPVREMNVITGKIPVGFKLVDFDIPPLSAGRSEVVTFTIKNIDNVTHSLQFYIGLPKDWKADPEKIVANISANEVRKFRVSLIVPEGAVKGSYIVQTLFFWDENSFIRDIQVTVAKPISMLLVLIIIIGVGTIVYIVYRIKRRREIRPTIEKIRRIAYEVGER